MIPAGNTPVNADHPTVIVRNTRREDFDGIMEMCRLVYPESPPWNPTQLESHLNIFPEGQFVAIDVPTQKVVGMASSLIVRWDDYDVGDDWRDFTDHGMFTNHDPGSGRTLYAAEVMVRPHMQGRGVGKKLYAARRVLTRRLKLLRIRAGARLRGYHRHAGQFTPEQYVVRVIRKELRDPTLSFQLSQGFRVLAVVKGYLLHDPESLGYAAVIEWLNRWVAKPEDFAAGDPRYRLEPENKS